MAIRAHVQLLAHDVLDEHGLGRANRPSASLGRRGPGLELPTRIENVLHR